MPGNGNLSPKFLQRSIPLEPIPENWILVNQNWNDPILIYSSTCMSEISLPMSKSAVILLSLHPLYVFFVKSMSQRKCFLSRRFLFRRFSLSISKWCVHAPRSILHLVEHSALMWLHAPDQRFISIFLCVPLVLLTRTHLGTWSSRAVVMSIWPRACCVAIS